MPVEIGPGDVEQQLGLLAAEEREKEIGSDRS
jgi:hypothetical protein